MIRSEAEVRMCIECDICGKDFKIELDYDSWQTDHISLHNIEDKYMEDQSFKMENNTVYCKDCSK